MLRTYRNSGNVPRDDVVYFLGTEVENTKAVGQTTLFVVGERPIREIVVMLSKAERETRTLGSPFVGTDVQHIYLCANQSAKEVTDWAEMGRTVRTILGWRKYNLTLDVPHDIYLRTLRDWMPEKHDPFFIPMITVRLPCTPLNTVVKFDDVSFAGNLPGVWVVSAPNGLPDENFTPWDSYKADTILATRQNLESF